MVSLKNFRFQVLMICCVACLLPVSTSLLAQSGKTKTSSSRKSTSEVKTAIIRSKYAIVVTHGGRPLGSMVIELFPEIAPKHCANFDSLVQAKFYNGTAFHRVLSGFMIQGGDPNTKDPSKPKETWGMGNPSQTRVPAEFNQTPHKKGIISAARGPDPNSATSQFFICHADAPHLNGQYTAFGQVVAGLDIIDSIAAVKTEFAGMDTQPSRPVERVEMTIVPKFQYVMTVKQGKNSLGTIILETLPEVAPRHVLNFDSLVVNKFYDSTAFHRVLPNFMIQGGDPNTKNKPKETWGMGDPSQTRVPAEFSKLNHKRGMVSAARGPDPNSATSQFFICHGDPVQLDGQYSIFARVVSGMEVVDKITMLPRVQGSDGAQSAPLETVEMFIRRK